VSRPLHLVGRHRRQNDAGQVRDLLARPEKQKEDAELEERGDATRRGEPHELGHRRVRAQPPR
jgi:hypothetical protein